MNTLTAEIEEKECETLYYGNPELSSDVWHDLDDVIERGFDKLSNHYGVDMRALSKFTQYHKK
ncbi:MAG: hypothetical protein FWC39_01275 [Bacteroidetes bacterium]|nr:hypothetical protein [Bacteroidota bacterium]